MFDVEDFRLWLLAEGKAGPGTVAQTMRDFRFLQRHGLRLESYGIAADAVKRDVRGILALKRAEGKRTRVRGLQKVLNRSFEYQAAIVDERWLLARYALEAEPGRKFDPYTSTELAAIHSYRAGDRSFVAKRRRAMLWLFYFLGDRKRQIWMARPEDFDPERRAWRVDNPIKEGVRDWMSVPAEYWSDKRAPQAYLRARAEILKPGVSSYWVTIQGTPMSLHGFGNEFFAIRRELGIRINFNRFRHTRGTICEEHDVPLQTLQKEWRHRSPKSTLWYMQGRPEKRRETLQRCGVPGFKDARSRARSKG